MSEGNGMSDATKRVHVLFWAFRLVCFVNTFTIRDLLIREGWEGEYFKTTLRWIRWKVSEIMEWVREEASDFDVEDRDMIHEMLDLMKRASCIVQYSYDVRSKTEDAEAQLILKELREGLQDLPKEDSTCDCICEETSVRLDFALALGTCWLLTCRYAALEEHLPLIRRTREVVMACLSSRIESGHVFNDESATLILGIILAATERLQDATSLSLFSTYMPVIVKLSADSPVDSWSRKVLSHYYISCRPRDPVEVNNLKDFLLIKLRPAPTDSGGNFVNDRGDAKAQIVTLLLMCEEFSSTFSDECFHDIFYAVSKFIDWEDAMRHLYSYDRVPRFWKRVLCAAPRSSIAMDLAGRIQKSKAHGDRDFDEFAELLREMSDDYAWLQIMIKVLYSCADMLSWDDGDIDFASPYTVAKRKVIDVLVGNAMADLMSTFRQGISKLDSNTLETKETKDQVIFELRDRLVSVSSAIVESRTGVYLFRKRKPWLDQINAELFWMRSRCPGTSLYRSKVDEYIGNLVCRSEYSIPQICVMTLLCSPTVLNVNRPMRSPLRILSIDVIRRLCPFLEYSKEDW